MSPVLSPISISVHPDVARVDHRESNKSIKLNIGAFEQRIRDIDTYISKQSRTENKIRRELKFARMKQLGVSERVYEPEIYDGPDILKSNIDLWKEFKKHTKIYYYNQNPDCIRGGSYIESIYQLAKKDQES